MDETRKFGAYEVLRPLSQGGMGDVFIARRLGAHGFEKVFAIKTLRAELATEASYRAAFHDEARLVSRLNHPRIGQVFDYGEQDGTLYIVMELVEGVALSRILDAHGRLLPRTAVELVIDVARALHYAHEATDAQGKRMGVVHRDVSPQNIMLTALGDVKVIDFGIALMRNRQTPRTVQGVKGKVGYMPPEQLRGEALDARADVFALSVVLHEALVGKPLFAGDNVAVAVTAVLQGDVAPPSRLVTGVPAALDAIVMKGLARKATERFATAAALADALEALPALDGPDLATFAAARVPALIAAPVKAAARRETATGTGASIPVAAQVDSGRVTVVPEWKTRPLQVAVAPVPTPRRRWNAVVWGTVVVLAAAAGALGVRRYTINAVSASPPIVDAAPQLALSREPVATPPPAAATVPADTHTAPAPPPSKSTPPPKATAKKSRRMRPVPTTAVETVSATGFVSFAAEPYAHVRVDGRELGITPLLRQRLPVGQHSVEFLDPETFNVRLKRQVTVEEDKETWASAR